MKSMNYFKYKNFKNEINKQKEKAEELYKKKQETVICEYCKQLLKKQDAGCVYDLENKTLFFFHEDCFNKNERMYKGQGYFK